MSTTDTQLRPGIYRISVAHSAQPQRLTNAERYVTILPPSAQDEPEQEWRIVPGENDPEVITIERPSNPIAHLSYSGAPDHKPEEGERVELGGSEFPKRKTEWKHTPKPGYSSSSLHVVDSNLSIRIAPPKIFPPFLELGAEDNLEWVFEWLRDQ